MAQGSRRPQPPDDGQPGTLRAPRRLTVIDQAGDVVVEIQDDRAFEVATGRPLYLRGNGLFTSSRSGLVYVISNGRGTDFPMTASRSGWSKANPAAPGRVAGTFAPPCEQPHLPIS